MATLTAGAFQRMVKDSPPGLQAVLQVINFEKLAANDRYRLLVSDGEATYSHVLLAKQLHAMMENNEIDALCVIRVNRYSCNTIQQDEPVLVLLDLEVLRQGSEVKEKIGNPTQLNLDAAECNRVHKIATLTPNRHNSVERWRIRARVTHKSYTWRILDSECVEFHVNFLDESGEIRATCINDAVDKFYQLEVNKVYYVSRCTLKRANKQCSNAKNDYELFVHYDSVIEKCEDEVGLPCIPFDFVPFNEIEKHPAESIVDVIGVVKVCTDLGIIMRDLEIVDQSGVTIYMALWGYDAQNFDCSDHPVIAVKGAGLSYFGGRSLSVLASSQMMVNPDIREAHILREWYDRQGTSMDFSNWKTFDQVNQENLGQGDTADWFTKATLMHLKKDNCVYQACPTENCNKKLADQGNGMWRCEKCQREFPNYKWCMDLQATLSDFSGHQWVTSLQESAETLLGVKADELGEMRESNEAAFDQVFQQALFKDYVFKLRAKVKVYNEERRPKTECLAVTPVDYTQYGKHLVREIHKMGL